MARKLKVRFIQTEPAAYTSDSDWVGMSAEERGIYHSLIVHLGCSGGRLIFDVELLCKMCSVNRTGFAHFWKKNGHKFLQKNGGISHRRVSKELRRARKSLRQKQLAGLASANARSTPLNKRSNAASTKGREGKGREGEGNNIRNESANISANGKAKHDFDSVKKFSSASLRFASELESIIMPTTQSDRIAFRNLHQWITQQFAEGIFDEHIHKRILEYAKESYKGKKPIALFFSILSDELGYRRKR